MLNVTKHIIENGLESLKEDLKIDVSDYENFVVLNYSMINGSPKFHPVVDECRGLILRKDTWEPVCRSFDRFYNHGEDPRSDVFPMEDATVSEKIDGSLVRFWFNPFSNEWCASTRKMAFAEGCAASGETFLSVIENILGSKVDTFVKKYLCNDESYTYSFEMVSPKTRVVVSYDKPALYFLAVRKNLTGEYLWGCLLDSITSKESGILFPQKYTFLSMEDCVKAANDLSDQEEGYVANFEGWRIKIKSPAYLAIARLRNNGAMSVPRIVNLIWRGDEEEYLSYFNEDRVVFDPWIRRRDLLKEKVVEFYDKIKNIESRKEFASCVKNMPFAPMLFKRRDGKSFEEIFSNLGENGLDSKSSQFLVNLLKSMDDYKE